MKSVISSAALALVMASSCASEFPYKYYGIVPSTSKLLGPTPAEDLPLENCEPTDLQKGKCAVFFVLELDRMKADRIELLNRLKSCQEGRGR